MSDYPIPMTEAEVRDSQGRLIHCPKCKDGRVFMARDGVVKPCRECP